MACNTIQRFSSGITSFDAGCVVGNETRPLFDLDVVLNADTYASLFSYDDTEFVTLLPKLKIIR